MELKEIINILKHGFIASLIAMMILFMYLALIAFAEMFI